MNIHKAEAGDPEKLAGLMGPGLVDLTIRQSIQMCWSSLPEKNKKVEHLETEFRRLVERALKDLREDAKAFGIG